MRTILWATPALLAALLVVTPSAWAANSVGPTDIVLARSDGTPLQFIPLDNLVKIQITLNNTDSAAFNGSLTLRLVIRHEDGGLVYNQTIRRTVAIPAGESAVVEQNWPPASRKLGNHTLTISIDDSDEAPYAANFVVTETGVEAGSYAERLARYSWFIGAFVIATILFAVVLAARRA